MQINLIKYSVESRWYAEAVWAWIDYDEGFNTIIETYDFLDYLFERETSSQKP